MSFMQYINTTSNAFHANKDWRIGQAYFNTLVEARPDLAEKVRGTNLDPFYADNAMDACFVRFIYFVAENW